MTRLFIVRHGDTFEPGEAPQRIGGRVDLPLTSGGHRQSKRLAHWFVANNVHFDQAWSGPLTRTRQTACHILDAQQQPPSLRTAHWLKEIDHGPDEGLPETEVVARIGRTGLDAWERDMIVPPGWQVHPGRRLAAWVKLFAEPLPDTVLLVTSNGAARYALPAAGISWPECLKLRTGAFGEITRGTNGSWALAGWDQRPD